MKKQLLIAAVAATMSVSAMADISISGAAKVNYTNVDYDAANMNDSDTFKHEMDLKIAGKSGDTSVTMNFGGMDNTGNTAVATFNMEDAFVATSIEGVSIKAGQWDNGNNSLRASTRASGKFSASTTLAGVTVSYDAGNSADDTVKLSGSVAGVAVSYKDTKTGEDVTVSGSVQGVSISYLALNKDAANSDRSVVTISGEVAGVGVKFAQADADTSATITGDSWMGDFEGATGAYLLNAGQDVTSIELSTSIAGNAVKFVNTSIDGVTGQDTSFNKVIITRPLANGTTFEATYTDLSDDAETNTDGTTLDLELAVSF